MKASIGRQLLRNSGTLEWTKQYLLAFPNSNSSPFHSVALFLKPVSNPSHIKQILAQMIVQNQPVDHYSFIKLIDSYTSLNGFASSVSLFTQFSPFIDSQLYNCVLRSYTHLKKFWHSIFVFVQMHRHGISLDSLTFPAVIKSTAHLCRQRVGKSLHCCVIKMGFGSDLYANTALVHMYCFCTSIDDARRMFVEMSERNCVSWNALITGYVHNSRFLEAIDMFKEMLRSGLEPREVTIVEVLSACANLGALEQGKWVHDYVKQNRLALNVYVGTALIDMYAKCGNLEEVCIIFRAMVVKNVCTWNVLISAYAMNGRPEEALNAFYRMIFDDCEPDDVTFLSVLSACYQQGLVEEGQFHFRSMKEGFGLEPKIEHYSSMVDLLAWSSSFDDAMEIIRTMPLKPYPTIWRALLRASYKHGNSYLTELVMLELIELEPNNGDNFFLLSILYAQQLRWAEAEELREIMKVRGIEKIPGYSSIEMNGAVYEFVASFDIEPRLQEVYKLLANIEKELIPVHVVADCELL